MKTNAQLESEVAEAIKLGPLLKKVEIGVIAKDGIITLTGKVESFARKMAVETVVKGISGVKAIIEKIVVDSHGQQNKSDEEIAVEVLHALKWNIDVPDERIKVKIERGYVTLEGEVEWAIQRAAALKTLNHLNGLRGIINHIRIRSEKEDGFEKVQIEQAIANHSLFQDDRIRVKVNHHDVTLSGIVHSLLEKDIAEQVARKAPGVSQVKNELEIE
jgi:osmotically-inducible protein OsmY